ncbi:18594_t:CDS:2 [Acaulospora morrowiae]|uniref:18594_t:CDS:1 n=1 Tax=Acaulospora morrowiae TaxID=94023 RepID=A0A9N9AKC6_9GLOM|nr:18594_t:CDS:2 [Acaulospora morrowiae]
MSEKRVILLVGKTGNGKSTIANVLTNTNSFHEFRGCQSGTKECQVEKFRHEEIEYTIIDTPGICDTDSENEKNVYKKIVGAVYDFKDNLNQVLFVTKGRLTKEEIDCYNLLFEAFFDEEKIPKFITIVRTNFPHFEEEKERKEDIDEMIEQGGEISELIKFHEGKNVIHVENHPKYQNDRVISRTMLLKHLRKDEIWGVLSLKKSIKEVKFKDRLFNMALTFSDMVGISAFESSVITLGFAITYATERVSLYILNYKRKKVVRRVERSLDKTKTLYQELQQQPDTEKLDKILEKCINELMQELNFLSIKMEIERMFQEKAKTSSIN